jgi:hypothetical protein
VVLGALLLLIVPARADALVITFRDEAAYLAEIALRQYGSISEGFEDDSAWGGARTPSSQTGVLSQGVTWTSNHAGLSITTSGGAARTGNWGVYSSPHGSFDGSAFCDIPGNCGDGFAGTSAHTLFGVGVWIYSNVGGGGELGLTLDGVAADFDDSNFPHATYAFFGAIDTQGFTSFRFTELEGTNGDQVFIFGDDVTFAVPEPATLSLIACSLAAIGRLRRRPREW